MRIFITGGHFAPARAVIDELISCGGWEIFYLGRKYGMEDDQAEALEYQEIRRIRGVNYLVFTTGRLQPKFFVNIFQSIRACLKIFIGFGQALFLLLKYHPDVIISFGGYMALPVVIWAWLLGRPIATHEQTVISGRANKLISFLADKILVSWPDSLNYFPKEKTVLTGNPIRQEILNQRPAAGSQRRVIYVTGGNQGAHTLNLVIEEILPKLTAYRTIHQTGDAKKYQDFDRLKKLETQNYKVFKFLNTKQTARALAGADLVISRAGANTVAEILALGKKAILIPLPWAHNNEQFKNAQMAKDLGTAEILPQEKLTPTVLERMIFKILERKEKPKVFIMPDAAKKVVDEVLKLTK